MTTASSPVPAPAITDQHRELAAGVLERACGEGRLTLEEFSVRVGAVWAADTEADLARATEGLRVPAPTPVVGEQLVERVVNVFGESRRLGRWRLPRRVRVLNVFGSAHLDLREAILGTGALAEHVVTIEGTCWFGEVTVLVPEGVEVEMTGACVFGSRQARLAPVPRLAGTPVVQVRLSVVFGEVSVRSAGPRPVGRGSAVGSAGR